MIFDPYVTLQIDRNATLAGIKAAYRRRARQTHPDVAGLTDATEFQAVVKAFDILSDPEKRKQFDETGTIEDIDPLEDRKAAMAILAGLFETMVDKSAKLGRNLVEINFIEGIAELLEKNVLDAEITLDGLDGQIRQRLALRKKITRVGDGVNIFADKLTAQIEAMGRGQADQRQRLRILKVAQIEVGLYTNETEMIWAFQNAMWGFAAPNDGGNGWSVFKLDQP